MNKTLLMEVISYVIVPGCRAEPLISAGSGAIVCDPLNESVL